MMVVHNNKHTVLFFHHLLGPQKLLWIDNESLAQLQPWVELKLKWIMIPICTHVVITPKSKSEHDKQRLLQGLVEDAGTV